MFDLYKYTTNLKKAELYTSDPYTREMYEDLTQLYPRDFDRAAFLENFSFVVLKPETFISRKVEAAVGVLEREGFMPIWHQLFVHTRHTLRELWRFQSNSLTRERIRFVDRMGTSAPSAIILLEDSLKNGISASERISSLKGSLKKGMHPRSIRKQLGYECLLINYVHTPDEPVDFLREFSILTNEKQRVDMFASIVNRPNWHSLFYGEIQETYYRLPYSTLKLEVSRNAFIDGVERHSLLTHETKSWIISSLLAFENCNYQRLMELIPEDLMQTHAWDLFVTIAHQLESNLTGKSPILE